MTTWKHDECTENSHLNPLSSLFSCSDHSVAVLPPSLSSSETNTRQTLSCQCVTIMSAKPIRNNLLVYAFLLFCICKHRLWSKCYKISFHFYMILFRDSLINIRNIYSAVNRHREGENMQTSVEEFNRDICFVPDVICENCVDVPEGVVL